MVILSSNSPLGKYNLTYFSLLYEVDLLLCLIFYGRYSATLQTILNLYRFGVSFPKAKFGNNPFRVNAP